MVPVGPSDERHDTEPMPTADHYRRCARECEQMIDDLRQLTRPVVLVDVAPFVVGPLATVVDRAVEATTTNVQATLAELDALAVEARARAAVCDRYRTEVIQFRRADADYRNLDATARSSTPRPLAPHRPAPWASA